MSTRKINHYFDVPPKTDCRGNVLKKSLARYERAQEVKRQLEQFEKDAKAGVYGNLVFDHNAVIAGYVSRDALKIQEYSGKFGNGLMVDIPVYGRNSKYFERRYYIYR